MTVTMDLNVSPLPEDDEENFEGRVEECHAPEERLETAVETARREREERRRCLRNERSDDGSVYSSQQLVHNQFVPIKHYKTYDKNRLPPGWLDCPSSGQEIGRIIPSKVPLAEYYNDYINPGKRYSFKQVGKTQKCAGRTLGLVIDLTNTTRYYSPLDLEKEGIKYVKIPCKGHNAVPDNASVNKFIFEATHFLFHQKHLKKYILVHCTHGFNRTGFMTVHYLVCSEAMSVTEEYTKQTTLMPCMHFIMRESQKWLFAHQHLTGRDLLILILMVKQYQMMMKMDVLLHICLRIMVCLL